MRKEKRGRISRQDLQVGGKNGSPKEMNGGGQGPNGTRPWEQVKDSGLPLKGNRKL